MRLIDADKLHPDRMTNKGTVAISQSQIAKAPTVCDIEQIRQEIEKEKDGYPPSADEYRTINKVLDIIDKKMETMRGATPEERQSVDDYIDSISTTVDLEAIRKEIEKHIKEVKDAAERFTPNMGFFDAKLSGIYYVMAIIDFLQQERQEVDLAKEYTKYVVEDPVYSKLVNDIVGKAIACHFYELGLKAGKEEKE